MVVVEHLDESLDLGPLGDLLLAHGGGHLAGVAVDACDQSMAVGTVRRAIIDVLRRDDDTQSITASCAVIKTPVVTDVTSRKRHGSPSR